MKKVFLLFATFFMLYSTVFSQSFSNYTFSASSGTFTALTSPTTVSILDDDIISSAINIGFDFWYMGTKYTQFKASSNGYITFNTSGIDNLTNGLSSQNPRPIVAPLWDDLCEGSSSPQASYKVTGAFPDRVFTFEWLNWQWVVTSPDPTATVISFQVKLYETSGKIEFIYRQDASSPTGLPTASIGICGTGTGSGNFISLDGTGTSPSASTTSETSNLNTRPATGQTYTFTPTALAAPSGLTFTSVANTSMQLNWTDNSSGETGFAIYNSTDGTNFSYVATTSSNATSYSATGLTSSQNYSWRIYPVSESLGSVLTGSQSTLPIELASFNYKINTHSVILSWVTSSERNNSKIEIERKISTADAWSNIGSVSGHGNSNVPIEYSFIDKNLNSGTYNYRLKQIDYNGNYEYHYLNQEVTISNPNSYSLSQNYPNPFNPITKISYSIPESQDVKLILYDAMGKEIAILVNEFKGAGNYEFTFKGSNYSSGIYFYKLETNDWSKVCKMSLLK